MQRFYTPTEVITGRGCLALLGECVAPLGRRALLVCGASAGRSGLLERARRLLADAGVAVYAYDGVRGEATVDMVEEGLAVVRDNGCDVVVGLGGGSAIDTAKAVAGLATQPEPARAYHGGRSPEREGLPFIAVPTTAGTGAEVTKNAVLIDAERGVKESIRDDRWFARVALVDAETTLSVPPEVTAATGSDALCQAIEAYTSTGAGPVSDALAEASVARIGRGLLAAYRDGRDLAAREEMLLGSLMAGMAMASARLGGVHGMAHPLGARYGLAHGLICGLLLPHVMAYNLEQARPKYARIGRLLGAARPQASQEEAAQAALDWVRRTLEAIGIPTRLAPLGVAEADLDDLTKDSLGQSSLGYNPRPLAAEDVRRILRGAL